MRVSTPVIAHREVVVDGVMVVATGEELDPERAQALGLVDALGRPLGPADPPKRTREPTPLPSTGAGW